MPELMHPTQTGKSIFFFYGMLVIGGLSAMRYVFTSELSVKVTMLDVVLLVLLVYITINRYWLQPIHGFSMKYYELMGLTVLYITLRSMPKRYYTYFLLAVILGGIIQAIYGSLQLWGHYSSYHAGFRMTGSFFNPGPYAGYLAGVFTVSLGMYLFRDEFMKDSFFRKDMSIPWVNFSVTRDTANRWINQILFEYIPLVGVLSSFMVLPASQSRAAWLAAIISGLVLFVAKYDIISLTRNKVNAPWKKVLIGLFLTICLGGSAYGLYHFKKGSADGRLLIWKVTTNMIADHPWVGVGYDRFKAHYMNYQAEYFQTHGETGEEMVAGETVYAFNEPLQFVTEEGVIGLTIALLLTGIILPLFKGDNKVLVVVMACLLNLLVLGLFSYTMLILPIKLLLIFTLGAAAIYSPHRLFSHGSFRVLALIKAVRVVISVALILTSFFIFSKIQKISHGFREWNTALVFYQMDVYDEAILRFDSLYSIFSKDGDFLQQYGKALAMDHDFSEAKKILLESRKYFSSTTIEIAMGNIYKKAKDYDKAKIAYRNAGAMIPVRFYPKYLLAKLYEEEGDVKAAVRVAKELLMKDVKVESLAIDEMKNEMIDVINNY
ncbi:O-antigen ligase-like membrane protein [Marinoscillum furvescens DSM 4134]|uniref:O-antigen ligase-like membrane protein n=2 Tax=Marinoscillum furvescens TaxID=1026 RepID=A0A3D9KYQ3_MARFU|nr:O-antigen ligase-like membrane protein [Marinoscillum furvescens DSM 4134]